MTVSVVVFSFSVSMAAAISQVCDNFRGRLTVAFRTAELTIVRNRDSGDLTA